MMSCSVHAFYIRLKKQVSSSGRLLVSRTGSVSGLRSSGIQDNSDTVANELLQKKNAALLVVVEMPVVQVETHVAGVVVLVLVRVNPAYPS